MKVATESITLKLDVRDSGFTLYQTGKELESLREDDYILDRLPEVDHGIDDEGHILYMDVDVWTPKVLHTLLKTLETHSIPGTYTVEELGLKDVPFVEVLKAIKKLYEQKLTTPTQK